MAEPHVPGPILGWSARLSQALGGWLYRGLYAFGSVAFGVLFPVRMRGANAVPAAGPCLLVANHESFLDPPLIGLTCYRRKLRFLAKQELFKFAPFRWWITALGALPVDQNGNATAGIRAALKALGEGHALLMFPEGTRTTNGAMSPLKPGICLLLRKSGAPVVVVGVAGCFEAWPLFRLLPWPKPVAIEYRPWAWPADATDAAALADLEQALAAARAAARAQWRRIGGQPVLARKLGGERR
jgi:1-acyl-sn-glycerol-3-phosphate acyltransferase